MTVTNKQQKGLNLICIRRFASTYLTVVFQILKCLFIHALLCIFEVIKMGLQILIFLKKMIVSITRDLQQIQRIWICNKKVKERMNEQQINQNKQANIAILKRLENQPPQQDEDASSQIEDDQDSFVIPQKRIEIIEDNLNQDQQFQQIDSSLQIKDSQKDTTKLKNLFYFEFIGEKVEKVVTQPLIQDIYNISNTSNASDAKICKTKRQIFFRLLEQVFFLIKTQKIEEKVDRGDERKIEIGKKIYDMFPSSEMRNCSEIMEKYNNNKYFHVGPRRKIFEAAKNISNCIQIYRSQ